MNSADKREAEEYKKRIQDNALDIYEKKEKKLIKKNHKNLVKVRKFLGEDKEEAK